MTGLFVAVVGPSGAGKDTLIDFARDALRDRDDIRFVWRTITRPGGAGGEAHRALTQAQFERERALGRFALAWAAHGLQYGIAADTVADVAGGNCVVANLSRTAIAEAAQVYARLHVVHVTAPPELLAQRLACRARETAADIAARGVRAALSVPARVPVSEIVNDRPVAVTGARFVAAIVEAFGAGQT
jgi:phosphonate metabolism protein PhnN/1,5-bisphosphokinase (PRPP-forming)